jgi:hypothetical protein
LLPRLHRLVKKLLLLCLKLLLLLSKAIVLGLEAGQVALPPEAVTLLAALVTRREHAEKALGGTGSTRTHAEEPFSKDAVGFLMTTEGTEEGTITSRHDILRKQVLGARTRKGGASVKNFAVPR